MNPAESYFMVVVQEQNISRAAERLYLSQQNLSNCIKRLEAQYGTLFRRKPHFQLTPAGEALYNTLRQIQVLESSLQTRLEEIKNNDIGTIRFGIPPTRGRLLFPKLMRRFRKQFPYTQVELVLDETEQLEQQLLRGELDLILGIDAAPHPELVSSVTIKENIYLVVSQRLLADCGIRVFEWERLADLPFLLNPPISHLRKEVDRFFRHQAITPRRSTTVGDFELQLILAAQEEGACFCNQMMLHKMEEINQSLPEENRLTAFVLPNEMFFSGLSIVRHRFGAKSSALETFAALLAEQIREG